MPATTAQTVSVKLDNDMRKRIKHLADIRHCSTHWVMCEAIKRYVGREEKRETFRQETLRAWEEYQETGLHVAGDNALAWLETWGRRKREGCTCTLHLQRCAIWNDYVNFRVRRTQQRQNEPLNLLK